MYLTIALGWVALNALTIAILASFSTLKRQPLDGHRLAIPWPEPLKTTERTYRYIDSSEPKTAHRSSSPDLTGQHKAA